MSPTDTVSKRIDTGDERPDAVGDHKRPHMIRRRIPEQSETRDEIHSIIPHTLARELAVLVEDECREDKKRRSDTQQFKRFHNRHFSTVPAAGIEPAT